jgi:hypothetical protein
LYPRHSLSYVALSENSLRKMNAPVDFSSGVGKLGMGIWSFIPVPVEVQIAINALSRPDLNTRYVATPDEETGLVRVVDNESGSLVMTMSPELYEELRA